MKAIFAAVLLTGTMVQPAPALEGLHRADTFWPNGNRRTSAQYLGDIYHGEYRSWRVDGSAYELRHYDHGRESGLQRSWDETGKLYLSYEVRDGRRYGFVNAKPCLPAAADGTSKRVTR